jgi:predicted metalloprotease with PDZ domain
MPRIAFLLAAFPLVLGTPSARKAQLDYTLTVDSADLSGVSVALRIRNAPEQLRLAAHAHPEYDDKYWRHLEGLSAADAGGRAMTVSREGRVVWRVAGGSDDVTVRYRVRFPTEENQRAAWRPFLAPTGGLVGGPHSFLYVIGLERAPVTVTLELPPSWRVASGLAGPATARTFRAANAHVLVESPMLVGSLSEWRFRAGNLPHRVFYWRLPNAEPFDTAALMRGIEGLASQALAMFRTPPYTEYTFLLQDGAYGGLEHPNSVTLGTPSAALARNPHALLRETAHEFFHTWNLMAIKPAEYRALDHRVQAPVAGLWFSEGLTLFYADLLLRRAGLPTADSTRVSHLESLIAWYLSAPGNARFSADAVSRVAYNALPGSLGDYTASTHLQGELIGTVLDLVVRNTSDGARSMDDVMRLMYARFRDRGFTGADVQAAVEEVCSCDAAPVFEQSIRNAGAIDFDRWLAPIGLRVHTEVEPAVDRDGRPAKDLRAWGWEAEGEPFLRLRVGNPNSVWGKAGLHTNDQIVSIDGKPVRTWPELRSVLTGLAIGDSAHFVVQRPSGRFETTVVMQGFERPTVRIERVAAPSERQVRLREAWLAGR